MSAVIASSEQTSQAARPAIGTRPDRLVSQPTVIATTLALDPDVILLDEPMAGMGQEDIDRTARLISGLRGGCTVLMVEHNLGVVADISDTITVLRRGEVIAEGDYATVSANEEVRRAYMGGRHA